ncbi:unnamed protein product [Spirodela intermedia]|uniref:Uncharacterized protein n=1 Tax=Spirodela intermedia TaxID=51605 RepID=A0A7I8IRP5_SPIIN|nr:unnamed protein product [Spirodela intermedia]CAA6660217.1 unnamed protein product [Spirodela intermedia]
MWSALNHGGRTVFLEEDEEWIAAVRRRAPSLESYHIVYTTKLHQGDALLQSSTVAAAPACAAIAGDMRSSRCPLALAGLPDAAVGTEWDVIMVDAPTGYFAGAPGRMGAIYTAGMMARRRKKAGRRTSSCTTSTGQWRTSTPGPSSAKATCGSRRAASATSPSPAAAELNGTSPPPSAPPRKSPRCTSAAAAAARP